MAKVRSPVTCKIKGCQNPIYGHGLCAKHYFRQRRHGDTGVTHKPGPKPSKPKPEVEDKIKVAEGLDSSAEDERLRTLLARADAEIAELRRWQAETQEQARGSPAAAQNAN